MILGAFGELEDPIRLPADEAVAALEAFVESGQAPRWFQERFVKHNRERQARAPPGARRAARAEAAEAREREQEEDPPEVQSRDRERLLASVPVHKLQWARSAENSVWSVREALQSCTTPPSAPALRERAPAGSSFGSTGSCFGSTAFSSSCHPVAASPDS